MMIPILGYDGETPVLHPDGVTPVVMESPIETGKGHFDYELLSAVGCDVTCSGGVLTLTANASTLVLSAVIKLYGIYNGLGTLTGTLTTDHPDGGGWLIAPNALVTFTPDEVGGTSYPPKTFNLGSDTHPVPYYRYALEINVTAYDTSPVFSVGEHVVFTLTLS